MSSGRIGTPLHRVIRAPNWTAGSLPSGSTPRCRTLPAGYRAVVVMRDVYGFSLEEVGNQLGISEGAAKVRLHRARQKLKEMLGDVAPAQARTTGPGTSPGRGEEE